MLYSIIMAGGSGTRFWPMSRELFPKQFLAFDGNDSLLAQTVDRILPLIPEERIAIVVGPTHSSETKRILQRMNQGDGRQCRLVVEPRSLNTLPAISVAALQIEHEDPEGIVAVMSSDHMISPQDHFLALIQHAAHIAETEKVLVTFGIPPQRPETGFGYLELGESLPSFSTGLFSASRVKQFVEKPDRETAERFLRNGTHLWNSGMFVFGLKTYFEELALYQPELSASLNDVRKAIGTPGERKAFDLFYRHSPSLSIDYGLMEHSKRVWSLSGPINWKDVGSWSALDDISPRDAHGNILRGNAIVIDSENSIIHADKRVVATVGIRDLIVVDTDDATLICHKDQAQKVREVVSHLKEKNAVEALEHRTTHRPWGQYTILDSGSQYKIKIVTVNPCSRLSLQMHLHRSEHWVIIAGAAKVTLGIEEIILHTNQSIDIPKSTKHRIGNPGKIPLVFIEVQNGEYLEEDDIIRFHDDYRRIEDSQEPFHADRAGGSTA
jgi:mannose-1-phosphate guanylyltransferase/mannose-6-phosphate isomerase